MLIQCPRCFNQLNVAQPGVFTCQNCGYQITVQPEVFMQQMAVQQPNTIQPQVQFVNQAPVTPVMQVPNQIPAQMQNMTQTQAPTHTLPQISPQTQAPAQSPASTQKNSILHVKSKKLEASSIALVFMLIIGLITAGVFGWMKRDTLFPASALSYVPENAEFVFYTNTKALFDNKLWDIVQDSKIIPDNELRKLRDKLQLSEIEDLEGNSACWFDKDKRLSGVVVLKKAVAEKIFNAFQKEGDLKNTTVAGKPALVEESSWRRGKKNVDFMLIMLDKHTLQFHFYENDTLYTSDFKNPLARKINDGSLFSIAISKNIWQKQTETLIDDPNINPIDQEILNLKNLTGKLSDAGDIIAEVTLNDQRVQVKAHIDISKIKK